MGVVYGIGAGLAAAVPLLVALRRERMTWGIASVLVAFALMHVAAALVLRFDRAELVPFAAFTALSFLVAVVVGVLHQQ